MGNTEILKRGDVQLTSAGTGISHSEKTHGPAPVHFLQIWAMPSTPGLPPRYYTRHFADADKADKWACVVAPVSSTSTGVSAEREGKGPAPVQSPLTMYASLLSPSTSLERPMVGAKGYVHVVQTSGYNDGQARGASVKIGSSSSSGNGEGEGEVTLREGDGAYVFVGDSGNVLKVENVGDSVAEVVLFDIES
jgi:hypothetical protein